MGVIGARLSPILEERVQVHCRALGKTPSVWVRELIEREISGKTPSPAVGEAIKGLNELVSDNAKFMIGILTACLGIYKTLIQSEISSRPERAKELEKVHSHFVEGLLESLPLKEQVTVEMGVRVSDLTTEIERIRSKKQILKEV